MRWAGLVPEELLPQQGPPPRPWPHRTARIGGLRTRIRDTPTTGDDARPAAYVHGLGGSAQDWTDLAGVLAPWYDGQAIDLPGFGGSEPLRRYSLPALADQVVRWLEYEDRGPVHLFGNSLGGALTVRVAALRPDLVRSLTLIAPAMPFLSAWESSQGPYVPLIWLPGVARVMASSMAKLGPHGLTRESLRNSVHDVSTVADERIAGFAEGATGWLASPWYAHAYVSSFRALIGGFLRGYLPGGDSLWRLAARIQAPTLVVWGRADRLMPVRLAGRVLATVPDSRLLLADEVGHVPHLEHPRLVARAVLAQDRTVINDHQPDEGRAR